MLCILYICTYRCSRQFLWLNEPQKMFHDRKQIKMHWSFGNVLVESWNCIFFWFIIRTHVCIYCTNKWNLHFTLQPQRYFQKKKIRHMISPNLQCDQDKKVVSLCDAQDKKRLGALNRQRWNFCTNYFFSQSSTWLFGWLCQCFNQISPSRFLFFFGILDFIKRKKDFDPILTDFSVKCSE